MKKIGIFYGPTGGFTEKVAMLIQKKLGVENADLKPIIGAKANNLDKYDNIIFGCSTIGGETWDSGRPKPDWDVFKPEFDKINYSGKTFALFGLGDNISYPRHFVDNLGVIGGILLSKNAKIVGQIGKDEYEFTDSEALIDGKFIGLPINEEFESDKTEARVDDWIKLIAQDFR
ncbi:MAG: flavodoxin FldA [Bacteroidales bacterium]|nr:MAG: flavodoxin FldA [Bacteroidales bacterium]